jgi:hypothetical protein
VRTSACTPAPSMGAGRGGGDACRVHRLGRKPLEAADKKTWMPGSNPGKACLGPSERDIGDCFLTPVLTPPLGRCFFG